MKKASLPQFAIALLLAAASSATLAATATIITEVNTLVDPNGTTSRFACSNSPNCDRNVVIDAPLVVSDPDGVSAASNLSYEFFAPANTSGVADFLHTGAARAQALPGSLHASAEVQLTGTGGSNRGNPGVSAFAYVEITDQIKINSSSLARGTIVTLNALLNVTGQGRGRVGLIVRGHKVGFGLAGLFGGEDISSREADSLEVISGQFTAEVGGILLIEYFLKSSTGVWAAGWGQADRLNGRAGISDYSNSAFLSFSAADPANVTLKGLSGFDYVQASPVPVPAAFWLLIPGIAVLARRRRVCKGSAPREV